MILVDAGASVPLLPTGQSSRMIRPDSGALQRDRNPHCAAHELAENAPHILADPAATQGLEQSVIYAWIACMASANDSRDDRAVRRGHDRILRRFRRI